MPFIRGTTLGTQLQILESYGLTDVLLPFLLIFTLIFAMLQKIQLLGEKKKNLNVVVAVIFALLVVIPHVTRSYPRGFDVVEIMNSALPAVSLVIVAVLMLLLLIGLFGGEAKYFGVAFRWPVIILSLVIIIWIFGASANWWWGWGWFNNFFGSDAVMILIILIVFGVLIAWVTGGDEEREERTAQSRLGEDIRRIFGGGKE